MQAKYTQIVVPISKYFGWFNNSKTNQIKYTLTKISSKRTAKKSMPMLSLP